MHFPDIDPVAFQIGSFSVRWYGISYMLGIVLGWLLARRYVQRYKEFGVSPQLVDDFVFWVTIGILVGGRLGYVLLYHPMAYWQNPAAILRLQDGGMSFHGGFMGVVVAGIAFCRYHRLGTCRMMDVVACVAPIGLGLGRIANFINGELWGRVTTVPWGMVFPTGGPLPRHPSQLYEAALEGVLMFCVLNGLIRLPRIRASSGFLTGAFGAMYGAIRFTLEFYREPDAELIGQLTKGQTYSLPMLVLGMALMIVAYRHGGRRKPVASVV